LKKNRNKRIVLYIVAAVILIALMYFANNSITGNVIVGNTTKKFDYSRAGNPDYYSLLPSVPTDFDQVKIMWEKGIIRDDPDRIDETYWKQPEWFPKYQESFVPTLENLVEIGNIEPIWSLGIFDSQIYSIVNKAWLEDPTEIKTSGHGIVEIKNDSIIVKHRFWVRAVPGAVKHFGVGLSTAYPNEATVSSNAYWGIKEQKINQDIETAQKYIKAWSFEKESGSEEFTLGVYWPKIEPDYLKEIEVEAEINKEIPKGKYIVQINAEAPSREYQQDQSLKYGLAYTDPNIGMFKGPNKFTLFIEVI